jgi:DNA-dependent RNA polymerase auxiliary subunit epsilon
MAEPLTQELIVEHARLMNTYGTDSEEVRQFLEQHKGNVEFLRLASTASLLKRALSARNKPSEDWP